MSLRSDLDKLQEAAQAVETAPLPHRDLGEFAWRYLMPLDWQEDGRNPLSEALLKALLAPVETAYLYAAYTPAGLDPRSAPEANLPNLELWANAPLPYRWLLPEWAWRGLVGQWRYIEKHAGLPRGLKGIEHFFPGLVISLDWDRNIPYRREVIAQLPLEGLSLVALKVLVRNIIPSHLQIELNFYPVSRMLCDSGSGLIYAWLGEEGGYEGNAWLNPEELVVEVI